MDVISRLEKGEITYESILKRLTEGKMPFRDALDAYLSITQIPHEFILHEDELEEKAGIYKHSEVTRNDR